MMLIQIQKFCRLTVEHVLPQPAAASVSCAQRLRQAFEQVAEGRERFWPGS